MMNLMMIYLMIYQNQANLYIRIIPANLIILNITHISGYVKSLLKLKLYLDIIHKLVYTNYIITTKKGNNNG